MEHWLKQSDIVAAMSIEALLGNLNRTTQSSTNCAASARVTSARNIMKVLDGSDLTTGKMKTSAGRLLDAIDAAGGGRGPRRGRLRPRAGGDRAQRVGDTRSHPEQRLTLTGANFQGSPVALPMDMAGAAITWCACCRAAPEPADQPGALAGPADFLAHEPGFYSGLMLSQYTADHLIVEQRILSAPASIQSIPARLTRRTSCRWA